MRVLHWYANFYGGGGVAIALAGLARAQQELGAEVAIAAAAPSAGRNPLYESVDIGDVELVTWRPRWTRDAGGLRFRVLRRSDRSLLRRWAPDVVHVHGEYQPDNLRVPGLFACPVVLEPCGAFHPAIIRRGSRRKYTYIALARRLLYSRVAAFHAYGPGEVPHIEHVAPGAQVYAVTQGVNTAFPIRPAVPPLQARGARLVFAGRLDVYHKGLDRLIDAFAIARERLGPEASLTLVGPSQEGSTALLSERASSLGIRDAVHFTGAMTADDLAEELAAADIYVQVSRHEGFTMTVAEALLAGKPVVVTPAVGVTSLADVRGLEHVVVTGEDVDDIAAALVTAAADRDRLARSAAQAQPRLRELLSWTTAARSHFERYAILSAAAS